MFEYGIGQNAQIVVEDNDFMPITIPANFKWQPGQHCFLRFCTFGLNALTSHPFTICSLPSTSTEKPSELVFYVRRRGGFTRELYSHTVTQPGVPIPVLVDGPYGGIDNQKYLSSDRLIVAAGGSGAGWMLPFLEQFIRVFSLAVCENHAAKETRESTQTSSEPTEERIRCGPRSLRIILATRDVETRTWFYGVLDSLLLDYESMGTTPDLRIEVHLTGEAKRLVQPSTKPASDLERGSGSSSQEEASTMKVEAKQEKFDRDNIPEEETRGRPDLPAITREEAAAAASMEQKVGVFVRGPLEMQDDVRNAVARENLSILKNPKSGGMYLHLEHFSWA